MSETSESFFDEYAAEIEERYGGGVWPDPPVSLEDPFGHSLRNEAHDAPLGPVCEDDEEYQRAFAEWLEASPVKPAKDAPLARVPVNEACPVCDKVCETKGLAGRPDGYAPGCYVAYAGRRWDCFEYWGRNLSADERRAVIEHERRAPRLKIELPDGSGTATV